MPFVVEEQARRLYTRGAMGVSDIASRILLTRWSGATTVNDVERYAVVVAEALETARAHGFRIALVADARELGWTAPEVRRAIATLDPKPVSVVGNWVVSEGHALRGLMTALLWLKPAFACVRVVSSIERALKDAETALRDAELGARVARDAAG